MHSVKEAIEEMIEESYLLGLSEEEIRRDFIRFIETCFAVIQANVRDRAGLGGLAEDLSRERACTLIADRTRQPEGAPHGGELRPDAPVAAPQGAFAEKVARRKRLILKTIGNYDSRLVRLIDEQRFQADVREVERPRFRVRPPRNWERYRLLLLKVGYATTVLLIMLLIYLGLMQRS